MEPSPFNDVRTIWFGSGQQPRATTDHEIMLERYFDYLVDRSMTKFPDLWYEDEDRIVGEEKENGQSPCNFLSSAKNDERVDGHYCVIKPVPDFMRDFLRQACELYGYIVESKIVKSKLDGAIMGIVDFKDKESAERAVKAIDRSDLGDGVILLAKYIRKQKRSKVLDLIADRQSRAPIDRSIKKQQSAQSTTTTISASEANILTDLCQQWAYFSEMNGSIPLNTLIWNLSTNKVQPPTTLHEPIVPKEISMTKEIEDTLKKLDIELSDPKNCKYVAFDMRM